MRIIKPFIRLSENVKGNKYYVTITKNGETYNKMFDTLIEAETVVNEIKANNRVKGFDYPLDFIDALFGDDKAIDIGYIETHFDENIKRSMESLTEREIRIVTKRLIEGLTLESVGIQEGVTRDRIRQIEAKALRKLRHPSRLYYIRYGEEVADLQDDIEKLTGQLLVARARLIDQINNPSTIPLTEEEKVLSTLSTKIVDMDFSVRTYNCLKRSGIETLSQLVQMTMIDLMKVRNLGRKSLKEINCKLEARGLHWNE